MSCANSTKLGPTAIRRVQTEEDILIVGTGLRHKRDQYVHDFV